MCTIYVLRSQFFDSHCTFVNKTGSAHFPVWYDINVYIIISYLYILFIRDNVENNALYQNRSAPTCFLNGESLFLDKEKK